MKGQSYTQRILSKIQAQSGLCVGLDPSREQLLIWELSDTVEGLKTYCDRMLKVCVQSKVAFVKPQSAFFERFGWEGAQILADLNHSLRQAGAFTIFDGKRGDIGSTAEAYAEAYLSAQNLTKYDAMTINPFLGEESLTPFIKKMQEENVGVFVVVRSSNPSSEKLQEARVEKEEKTVAEWLAQKIDQLNAFLSANESHGPIGAVIGATLTDLISLLDLMPSAIFLCPGVGAQGASIEQALKTFKPYLSQCIFPMSRGITLSEFEEKALISKIINLQQKIQL